MTAISILRTAYSHIKGLFPDNGGFTLLEVMISVSIIAIIFVSLFRMQSQSIVLAETGRFNTLAPVLAERLLIRIEKDIRSWSESEGDFGENYPGFRWTCEIEDFPNREIGFAGRETKHQLKKITIRITGLSRQASFKTETWRVVFD